MPHHRSAAKRLKQSAVARLRNRSVKARLRSAIKTLTAESNPEQASTLLTNVHSMLDKAAKRHILHPSTVDRQKSRLAKRVNQLAD